MEFRLIQGSSTYSWIKATEINQTGIFDLWDQQLYPKSMIKIATKARSKIISLFKNLITHLLFYCHLN